MTLDERARRAAASVRDQAEQVDTDAILDRVRGTGGRPRWVVPAVAGAGAAAVVILVVALVLPQLQVDRVEIGPDPAVPGDPEPSPTETATSGQGTALGLWQRVTSETFTGAGDDRMRAVAQGGGATVAVGRRDDGPGIWWRDAQRPAGDPGAWEQVGGDLCGEASCELNDVAAFGGRFVAAGMLDGLPKLWWSDDGHAWNRVDLERSSPGSAGETTLTAVALGPDGAVAFGSEVDDAGSRPVVFTSSDGRSWTEGSMSFDQEEAGAHVVDAVDLGGGRFLAVGYVGDGTVLWEEQDGTWAERHLAEVDPEFSMVATYVTSLSGGPEELLLTGSNWDGEDRDGRVWRSTDGGETWERMPGELEGPGDQQVSDLFRAGGSVVAVGWEAAADGGAPQPAAWILHEGRWEAVDGGDAFAGAGTIQAVVEADGHSAIAVGTAGDTQDPNEGAGPVDAAVWTYTVPEGTTSGGSACSAASADQAAPQPDLPDPVADIRRAIHEAAAACQYEALATYAQEGSRGFTYSFGDDGDPAGYWRRLEEEGAAPLETLTRVLDLPYATVETQFVADEYETVYVWPSAFADDATDADWRAVIDAGLVTQGEAERMRGGEGYTGYRVGITADGEWVFFVAGD